MNMSYCRFQNTANDLQDCLINLRTLDPNDMSPNDHAERQARATIILLAASLLEELGIDDIGDSHAIHRTIAELDQAPVESEQDECREPFELCF